MKRPELAKRAELSYPYVSEIENGLKTPSTKALRQLAAALDCSPADLISLADRIGGAAQPDARSVLVDRALEDRRADRSEWLAIEASTDRSEGAPAGAPVLAVGADEMSDWRMQTQITAIVRAELAAWARTQLPELVRGEIKRALRERS